MFRYISLVWNTWDQEQNNSAEQLMVRLGGMGPKWQCALARSGIRVYYTGERRGSTQAYQLRDNCGVVLGTLFKGEKLLPPTLSESDSRNIVDSNGRELVNSYWGNYVAFLHENGGNGLRVLRGPASSLPCLRTKSMNVEVFFSSMDDCLQLNLRRFSIDWRTVAMHMLGAQHGECTGLREVGQIEPGSCLELVDGRSRTNVYWDPLSIQPIETLKRVEQAAPALRDTVKLCVHAWASCYSSVVHNLSGGLDSSIVLACLKDAPARPRVTCLTEFSMGADTDEREYARLVVKHTRFAEHVERQRDPRINLDSMLQAISLATPRSLVRRVETARPQAELTNKFQARAIFSGSGGDAIFFQSRAPLTVADFIFERGFHPTLARVAYDAALVESVSIWNILKSGISGALRGADVGRQPTGSLTLISSTLTNDDTLKNFAPAFAQHVHKIGPGKCLHARALAILNDYYDPMGQSDDPELIAPLLSQPLIELVLRIPTYTLMVGGWDRGLARLAFESELPREIARRRGKGGIEEHMKDIFNRNLPFIRSLLLDGMLVERGLLNRVKLTEALAERPSCLRRGMIEALEHLSTEAWLRRWTDARQAAAA